MGPAAAGTGYKKQQLNRSLAPKGRLSGVCRAAGAEDCGMASTVADGERHEPVILVMPDLQQDGLAPFLDRFRSGFVDIRR